jgi:hypothetical protein
VDTSKILSTIPGKILNVLLEKDGEAVGPIYEK